MAHADYHCCAVCDRKISYGGADAATKEFLCARCAATLSLRAGRNISDTDELLRWIEESTPDTVRSVLTEANYRECCYPNKVDQAIFQRLGRSIPKD